MTDAELLISSVAFAIALLLLFFAVDWRYARDWIAIYFFKCTLDLVWGSAVVSAKWLEYPHRILPQYYETCILFEIWVFPILCILYNQKTMNKGLVAIIGYALLFSAGITAIEYPLERYTELVHYLHWSWFTSFYTLTITFLMSRTFIAVFRWICDRTRV